MSPALMANAIPNILTFLTRVNTLKNVRRYKSSLSENGDTVADHSWRLTLMIFIIGNELKAPVQIEHAMKIALVHDLAELKTDDIDAYEVIQKRVSLEEKQKNEIIAMKEIVDGISFGDEIYNLWEEFEKQETLEAKFVKALDKIEAFMHLDETGTGVYLPDEFHGDYADAAVENFDNALTHFPLLQPILDPIKENLKQKFADLGIEWVEKKNV